MLLRRSWKRSCKVIPSMPQPHEESWSILTYSACVSSQPPS
uniref:Uncharacterized protein n=1 Tax=Anguilla anguilla TaxID=7936 RepID=A0A0E9PK20_ANGAN